MTPEEEKVVMVIIIFIIAAVTIYIELRIRKSGFGKKVSSSRFKKDQAYNAVHTTKAVRNKLKADRVNTLKADYMITRAESAFEDRDYDSCIDLCRQSREMLLRSKKEGDIIPADEPPEPKSSYAAASQRAPEGPPAAGVSSPAQLQANFELKAARADIESFTGDNGIRQRASQLVADAERHFNAKDFQKSLSSSFRARKLMSGEAVEEKPAPGGTERIGKAEAAPKQADNRCEACGAANEPEDIFCHSCGKQLRSRKCASCGADLKGYEKFCRKCGKPAQ
jgi:hypothetical protein